MEKIITQGDIILGGLIKEKNEIRDKADELKARMDRLVDAINYIRNLQEENNRLKKEKKNG